MMYRYSLPTFSFHHRAHLMLVSMIVVSVLEQLIRSRGVGPFIFLPYAVLTSAQIWRPLSGLFVAVGPTEIIFGGLILYSIGGHLERVWGQKTFVRVALGIPLLAHFVILALALIIPAVRYIPFASAQALITTVWILFGLQAWLVREELNFWGTPITGKNFALIGLGFVVLAAIFGGVLSELPSLISATLCYAFMYRRRLPYLARRWSQLLNSLRRGNPVKKPRFQVVRNSPSVSELHHEDDSGPLVH
jgi:membrane associated rhomboid family serine protease